jgi:Ca2+/Na+ antiporter
MGVGGYLLLPHKPFLFCPTVVVPSYSCVTHQFVTEPIPSCEPFAYYSEMVIVLRRVFGFCFFIVFGFILFFTYYVHVFVFCFFYCFWVYFVFYLHYNKKSCTQENCHSYSSEEEENISSQL